MPVIEVDASGNVTATNTFGPNGLISRHTASGSTFYTFIETIFNRGLVGGYGDGTFRPGNPLTRGQLSKVLSLAVGP